MFKVYDFEVFPNDWMVVILDLQTNELVKIHNDKTTLLSSLSPNDILVGFNNYGYDDIILWAIKTDQNPYEVSQKIIKNEFKRKVSCGHLTLDVKQETDNNLSLKEVMANLGLDIFETPVDFEKENLTDEEIELVFKYCENDVKATAELFKLREDYFTTKFEIVETFKLLPSDVKKTRANLAARVLNAVKIKDHKHDRLNIRFDERLKLDELPKSIVDFYKDIIKQYQNGMPADDLEKQQFEYQLAGLPHKYGFGGLHAAKENYVDEGNFLHIDAKSFYPTLIINNNFMSRASTKPERFKEIYNERLKLVEQNNPKADVYKIVLNSVPGGCKSEYNALYDPLQFNNIVVNSQLILTHLILLLEPFCELIQSNTDGLIIKYEDAQYREMIDEVIQLFAKQYNLMFSIKEINKIAQRDVNNYCVRYANGEVKAVGCMKYFNGGSWERNSLSIVDMALVNYYMYDVPIQKTVINQFKKDLTAFQIIAKTGSFDGLVHEKYENGESQMKELQKVNRLFATKDYTCGGVYRVRKDNNGDKYHKVSNSPEQCFIWNGPIDEMDRRKIDLNWYVKMIQNQLFV